MGMLFRFFVVAGEYFALPHVSGAGIEGFWEGVAFICCHLVFDYTCLPATDCCIIDSLKAV